MQLVKPSLKWEKEHRAYLEEWGPTRMIPSSFELTGHQTYETYLHALAERESGQEKWVPSSSYFLVNDKEKIVAMVDIRHELNDFLFQVGGHIGYGVRPSERSKGYATRILYEALQKCKELQIKQVLVTCTTDNIRSAKAILKNGGREDHPHIDEDGRETRRFWIYNE